jgi:hypothetical protein
MTRLLEAVGIAYLCGAGASGCARTLPRNASRTEACFLAELHPYWEGRFDGSQALASMAVRASAHGSFGMNRNRLIDALAVLILVLNGALALFVGVPEVRDTFRAWLWTEAWADES